MTTTTVDVLVIGAGAAGIGFGVALKELGINSYLIVEKGKIGESFRQWPTDTRFITPSFTSNGFGMPDLNALAPDTSPAYTLGKERLSGNDYAEYLEAVVDGYDLAIQEETTVTKVEKKAGVFLITTELEKFSAKYVIFALGEFQFPNKLAISGSELTQHYGEIESWETIEGESATIIGGNESGIDASVNLAKTGKIVTVYTRHSGLDDESADPSLRLSPFTRERLTEAIDQGGKIKMIKDHYLHQIIKTPTDYRLTFKNKQAVTVKEPPILCTGFNNGALTLSNELFATDKQNQVSLNEFDESTLTENAFIIGPSVRHQEVIFCYVYKFRQRFAYIIEEIAERENIRLDPTVLEHYQENAMYLDDCSACGVNCSC